MQTSKADRRILLRDMFHGLLMTQSMPLILTALADAALQIAGNPLYYTEGTHEQKRWLETHNNLQALATSCIAAIPKERPETMYPLMTPAQKLKTIKERNKLTNDELGAYLNLPPLKAWRLVKGHPRPTQEHVNTLLAALNQTEKDYMHVGT